MNDMKFQVSSIPNQLPQIRQPVPHTSYRNIKPFMLFILMFASGIVTAEPLKLKCNMYPYSHLIQQLEKIEKNRELRSPNSEKPIDVTKLVEEYIPAGCDLPVIITNLHQGGFDLNGEAYLKEEEFYASIHLFKANIFYLFKPYLEVYIKYHCNKIISVKAYTSRVSISS